jgi:glucokinase
VNSIVQSGGRLLADIGGTHARFAWQSTHSAGIQDVRVIPCAHHADLASAMRAYMHACGHAKPAECAIAIATPVTGDQVRMTNRAWSFSIKSMEQEFGFKRLAVVNDFTALALGVLDVPEAELRQVGHGKAMSGYPIGVIGPGTGLGVSGLIPRADGHWYALSGEGGHVTLAGSNKAERAVIEELASRHSHVSAERVLSGDGLVQLHQAVCRLHALAQEPLSASEITHRALASSETLCRETLNLFCAFLGIVAGNLALTLGARGGIYIGGGIVPRLGSFFDSSPFRERFEEKGRFVAYVSEIPTLVIESQQSPALLGASRALDAAA